MQLLQMAYELDIPISFGSDAHAKDQVGLNGEICEKIAKDIGYNKCAYFKNRDRYFVNF